VGKVLVGTFISAVYFCLSQWLINSPRATRLCATGPVFDLGGKNERGCLRGNCYQLHLRCYLSPLVVVLSKSFQAFLDSSSLVACVKNWRQGRPQHNHTRLALSSNLVRVVINGGTLHGVKIERSIDRPRKRACWGGNRSTSCPRRHWRSIACH